MKEIEDRKAVKKQSEEYAVKQSQETEEERKIRKNRLKQLAGLPDLGVKVSLLMQRS